MDKIEGWLKLVVAQWCKSERNSFIYFLVFLLHLNFYILLGSHDFRKQDYKVFALRIYIQIFFQPNEINTLDAVNAYEKRLHQNLMDDIFTTFCRNYVFYKNRIFSEAFFWLFGYFIIIVK